MEESLCTMFYARNSFDSLGELKLVYANIKPSETVLHYEDNVLLNKDLSNRGLEVKINGVVHFDMK